MLKNLSSWLERAGLGRPELRAWAMYDWANSAFMTTIVAAVFPVYFNSVAAADLQAAQKLTYFSIATTLALIIVAVISPFLGALADYAGAKKKMLAAFMGLGVLSTCCMYWIHRGDWVLASLLFVLGNIGVSGSFVFYDSLLPHIANPSEMDRVSSAGYALGYLGGGLLLAFNALWILKPAWFGMADSGSAARVSFLSVGIWWCVFSIPLFLRIPEPQRTHEPGKSSDERAVRIAWKGLKETVRELRYFKNALLMLLAFLIYNDGILTIIRMAAAYGETLGLPASGLIAAILLVQFIGIPFAFLFGELASHIGAKRAVFLSLVIYTLISILAYSMKTIWHFYLLATLVAMVQGGSQALSRSLFASMIPKHKSSGFFAFFAVAEKFAGIFGPAVFAVITLLTGSGRGAVLSIIGFFAAGAAILAFVNVSDGRRAARQAEEQAGHI